MTQILILIVVGIVILLALALLLSRAGGPMEAQTERHLDIVRRRMKDPASAILQVTGISEPSFDSLSSTGQLTGLVSGEGIEPQAVQRRGMIGTARWPAVGERLPIVIDRANPKMFVVDRTKLETGAGALDEAERLAAAMKAGMD